MHKVLMITNIKDITAAPRLGALREFVTHMNELDAAVEVDYCAVQELVFVVKNGVPKILLHGQELKDTYTVVHVRNGNSYMFYAAAIGLYAQHFGLRLINEGDVQVPWMDKVSQGFAFGLNGIKTPDLVSAPRNQELLEYLMENPFDYPFIVKHANGIRGQDNYLVHDQAELRNVLSGDKHGFVAQPFIQNVGELRILTFGQDMAPLIFKKTAASGSHLNNTAQGSSTVELKSADIAPELIDISLKIARLTRRDITGVDVLLGTDGQNYILEANHTAALATGVFSDAKQRYYVEFIKQLQERTK